MVEYRAKIKCLKSWFTLWYPPPLTLAWATFDTVCRYEIKEYDMTKYSFHLPSLIIDIHAD